MKATRTGILVSALPSLVMLALFYSLAIHMRYSLGAWPTSIGNRGFPQLLISHGEWAWTFFSAFNVVSVFVLPAVLVVCILVRRWRRLVVYFGSYALLYGICWGLILLAPAPFLNWWWD